MRSTAGAIELIPIAVTAATKRAVTELARRVGAATGSSVQVSPELDAPRLPAAGPVAPRELLDALMRDRPATSFRGGAVAIGITDRDLGGGGRSFVFGQATIGGHWALVSAARLADPGSRSILLDRLEKVVLHELGHLAGLEHCAHAHCAMHAVVAPSELDLVENRFCTVCGPSFAAATRS